MKGMFNGVKHGFIPVRATVLVLLLLLGSGVSASARAALPMDAPVPDVTARA